jgi:hypothetical protein
MLLAGWMADASVVISITAIIISLLAIWMALSG